MLTVVIILAVAGVLMVAMEVIMPGGILGVGGTIAIIASVVIVGVSQSDDIVALGTGGRFALGAGIIVGSAVFLVLWLKYFTHAGFVKRHLLETQIDEKTHAGGYEELLGQAGTAETDLRPSGKARIDGRKRDVLAESGLIERGTAVKVVKVEGSRVVVRASS